MTVGIDESTAADLFSSGGDMCLRLRQVNWQETAFGPVSQWSQSLVTLVKICVDASSPMAVWWRVDEAASEKDCLPADRAASTLDMICNDAYQLKLGLAAFESSHALPRIVSHQAETEAAIWSAIATGKTALTEVKTTVDSGKVKVFSLSCSPLFDEADEIKGVFGSAAEKTVAPRTEESQLQVRNVLESISDAFIALDKDWCYTYVNKKAAELLHQERESLVGQPLCEDAFPGKVGTLAYNELRRAMAENVPVVFEDHSPSFDAWFEVHGYPSEEGLAIYFQDVSDRKQAEADKLKRLAEERAAREAAEAASRLKDEFLAVVSHELRSPLNPILGCAKLLRKGELTPERKEQALRSIERNALIQAQLVNDLLDVSRILRGELDISTCAVPVESAVLESIETLSLEAKNKEISIETYFGREVGSVLADPGRFQQIMWNLLSNAIKFTPRLGRIVICASQVNHQVKISITDTGKGITSGFLPHVFDRFRQEDAATTRQFGGLGLGLSIVRHLVELHEGAVAASSPGEDKGATFTVFLPLGRSSEKIANYSLSAK